MPINDLGTGTYQGFEGGLYPAGTNARPLDHNSAGLTIASQIIPVDATGASDPTSGKIVLASLGLSNTTYEWQVFMTTAAGDTSINPKLVLVDGAQSGVGASRWANASDPCWTTFASRLSTAGVAGPQLQVVWVKLAEPAPNMTPGFPAGAQEVEGWIKQAILNLKSKYPSVRMVFLSSRIYAGYATSTLNPEPIAYENGFCVKWLIEAQISGDATLAYSGASPPAPWLSWIAYLWADGTTPRSDGLTWLCPTDYESDGTHPSMTGRHKVANLLMAAFKTDPTCTPWFLANGGGGGGGGGGGNGGGGSSGGGGDSNLWWHHRCWGSITQVPFAGMGMWVAVVLAALAIFLRRR